MCEGKLSELILVQVGLGRLSLLGGEVTRRSWFEGQGLVFTMNEGNTSEVARPTGSSGIVKIGLLRWKVLELSLLE